MKILSLCFATLFCLLMPDPVISQTTLQGKLLSVDGTTIPKTVISIRPEVQQDIFSDQYKNVYPGQDGSYQLQIKKPGLYRLTFRGVFHHEIRVPIMIYDQPEMRMNVLLLPRTFNDGVYFGEEEYLEWIRIVGNFNDYNYHAGERFKLNSDGSISAFVPVNSDTIRYQVRGLTYNQGVAALPLADEFEYREDSGFESLLYDGLPKDSLEIRYDPKDSMPFERHFPLGVNPLEVNVSGFISFNNKEDENWVRPLSLLQPYTKVFNIVKWEMSEGVPLELQIDLQKKHSGNMFDIDFTEEFERVSNDLSKENLHPQQEVILTMSYTGIFAWMARKSMLQQMRRENPIMEKFSEEKEVAKLTPDPEIIHSVPEIVPASHPAWMYNNGIVDYLLTETDDSQKFVNYFHDVVAYNPEDRAVRLIASSMIRHLGSGYPSVEAMPVYQIILDRYGQNDLARDAHMAFRNRIKE